MQYFVLSLSQFLLLSVCLFCACALSYSFSHSRARARSPSLFFIRTTTGTKADYYNNLATVVGSGGANPEVMQLYKIVLSLDPAHETGMYVCIDVCMYVCMY